MPEGGVLRIATREVSEDQQRWIEIEVTDTGLGMTSEVLERAFEPFFTTKELGLGSGLGLSQVYGFVNQSGGEVRLESVPRKGSAFRLRLPATPGPTPNPRKAAIAPLPLGGSEVVLVVEDDSSVLALTVDMLKGQGYSVLTAANAAEAFVVLKTHPEVQVLFSDVTMPGLSGVGLARQALGTYPDLRILLTSGFVGDASGLGCEFPMLDKPFDSDGLAAALRRLLDAPAPRKRRVRRNGRKGAASAG
jgi:CheY-like chemotaxis protein